MRRVAHPSEPNVHPSGQSGERNASGCRGLPPRSKDITCRFGRSGDRDGRRWGPMVEGRQVPWCRERGPTAGCGEEGLTWIVLAAASIDDVVPWFRGRGRGVAVGVARAAGCGHTLGVGTLRVPRTTQQQRREHAVGKQKQWAPVELVAVVVADVVLTVESAAAGDQNGRPGTSELSFSNKMPRAVSLALAVAVAIGSAAGRPYGAVDQPHGTYCGNASFLLLFAKIDMAFPSLPAAAGVRSLGQNSAGPPTVNVSARVSARPPFPAWIILPSHCPSSALSFRVLFLADTTTVVSLYRPRLPARHQI